MFDGYRSEASVPVGPQGSYLQAKSCATSEDEREAERCQMAHRYPSRYARNTRFDMATEPGGSTFYPGEVLCNYEE